MYCRKCGIELDDSAEICPKCKTPTKDPQTERSADGKKAGRRSTAVIVFLIIVIVLLCAVLAGVIAYMYVNDKSTILNEARRRQSEEASMSTVNPTSSVQTLPTPTNTAERSAAKDDQNQDQPTGSFSTYSDKDYNFSCVYPSNFNKIYESSESVRYSAKSPDGRCEIKICAQDDNGITAEESLDIFMTQKGGTVDHKVIAGKYYAVRMINAGTCYYKYCRMKSGMAYWFEMTYPETKKDLYGEYENKIYNSFTVN